MCINFVHTQTTTTHSHIELVHIHILSWYILTYYVGKVRLYFYVLVYRVLSEQEIDERLLAIADQD